MPRRIRLVAWQEFVANVRTKTFWIGVLALPIIMALAAGIGIALKRHTPPAKPFAVVTDGDHGLHDALRAAYDAEGAAAVRGKYRWEPATELDSQAAIQEAVRSGRQFAVIILPANALEDGEAQYYGRNLADRGLQNWVQQTLQGRLRAARLAERGLDRVDFDYVTKRFELAQRQVAETGDAKAVSEIDMIRVYSPLAFVYMLWIAMITVAQMLLNNVIEEKSSRVIEVLLSSVSPTELMSGKILGIALTGLTLLTAWLGSLLAFIHFGLPVMELPVDLPKLLEVITSLFSLWNLSLLLTYFVLGFFFLAAIFAAIGSVCTSIKESQNLLTPVIFVLAVPLMTMHFVTENPHSALGRGLSWFPPFTPFVMMNRAAAQPPAPMWEIVASIFWLALWTGIAFILAGRVFRVGVLMSGKAPNPKEIWRLMWTK